MEEKLFGTVVWFSAQKGFGFIKPDDGGKDIFVHWSDIDCKGFKTIDKDQLVSYLIGTNHRGQPKAICVQVVEK